MAAYAAVVSLMNTIDNIHNHPLHSFSLDKKQIQSLHKIIDFLLDFIESYNSHGGTKRKDVLERRITSAAHTAEDVIESHVVDQILAGDHGETSLNNLLDLERVINDMKSVQKMVMQFKATSKFKDQKPSSYSMPAASSKPLMAKSVMVGLDEQLITLMERLTGQQPNLQIVPIVGMGGIGKTTLARNVYENLLIVEHFDIRAWVTISQEYSVKNIFSELLSCIKDREINKSLGANDSETHLETEDHELGVKLYRVLWGRRYLIVLDDIWGIEAWDKIRFFFPDNDHRSRVVITTRISNVASYLSSSSFEMNFLDEDKSWELFCENAFLDDGCPSELEEIGKNIVRECRGLPLSIVVIGGLLRNSRKTREYWESFARHTKSILKSGNDEHCLKILSLSYIHLPAHLKPCFLYMGVFREDYYICFSELIPLFVAEGFLKPNRGQSLEEAARDYLKDLVDRNLILVGGKRWKGKICYKMHDLVRELCLRIAEKEKFFYVMRELDSAPGIDRLERCIVVYNKRLQKLPQVFGALPSASLARTFKFEGGPMPFKFRLLRVLTRVDFESLEAIFQHVNLRYLSYKPYGSLMPREGLPSKLPSSLSLLFNLQILKFGRELFPTNTPIRIDATSEIWYMRQLRHLEFYAVFLPDPPEQQDGVLLPNLHTLSRVVNFSFTTEACKQIPNIKKLRIKYDDFSGGCQKLCLDHLHKLQSLNCSFDKVPERGDLLQSLVFPSLLRKLSLQGCHLHWEDLNTFGFSLPHLEVLKLAEGAVVGPEWECVEGAFPRLKFLNICCRDLVNWTAEASDFFPVLVRINLYNLNRLEKIPSSMGEMQTLEYLRLDSCSVSAAVSSTEILEEQLSLGNEDLQVLVLFSSMEEEESFRERVETERFSGKNFEQSTFGCIIT